MTNLFHFLTNLSDIHANLSDVHANLSDIHANLSDVHANLSDIQANIIPCLTLSSAQTVYKSTNYSVLMWRLRRKAKLRGVSLRRVC